MQFKTEAKVGAFILIAVAIFFYMTFHIGVFRFDRSNYTPYTVHFKDVAGLSKKADVKVSGVKVGWVDSMSLTPNGVAAHLRVLKSIKLRADAHGVVRQDGLIGKKYLELSTGDLILPVLKSGSTLSKPSRDAVSVDDIMYQFKKITGNVEKVSSSLKEVLAGPERERELKTMIQSMSDAAKKLASFSDNIDRLVSENNSAVSQMISDFGHLAADIKTSVPRLAQDVSRVANTLNNDVLPHIRTDVGRMSDSFEKASNAVADISGSARESFDNIGDVAKKINDGKGMLGKLVNDEAVYRDFKAAVSGVRDYLEQGSNLGIVVDMHSENFFRPSHEYEHRNAKGYIDMRIHPSDTYFYNVGLVTSLIGVPEILKTTTTIKDENDVELLASAQYAKDVAAPVLGQKLDVSYGINSSKYRLSLQFGSVYGDFAFRGGLFESTGGIGVDWEVPFKSDNIRWVTSLEAFDWYGTQRLDDRRPHLKWINRVYLFRNIYMTMGAEDFASKFNKNGFFGLGIRFGDDNLKYILPSAISSGM
ncbi:MCE family protein [bacterium]|nr:MCE family protein [bacterium]MBT6528523.1 MCE family protein [bacterium]